MMKNGQYTIESIEDDHVKLLLSEDESVFELLPITAFAFTVKEGDIVSVELSECGTVVTISLLQKETDEMRNKVSNLLEKLLNKNK
jgi:hypothetical protein